MKSDKILVGVREVLLQGQILLRSLGDDNYTQQMPQAFNASIGGHFRHCLDHFQCLLESLDGDEINYDSRRRDPRIERDRAFALGETQRLLTACGEIPSDRLMRPVYVRSMVSYSDHEAPAALSTLGRELMYTVAHAIHHYAIIGMICAMLGVSLPEGFGIAPSTLTHLAELDAAS